MSHERDEASTWWVDERGTMRDENRLEVQPPEMVARIRRLETLVERMLGEYQELRESLGDQGWDDRVTSGLHTWCDAARAVGADMPEDLELDDEVEL